jgi:dTMP kinase
LSTTPGSGVFLVLDGLDRAGKSTQLDLLASWLGHQGLPVTRCRDPGGTKAGDAIRSLLLDVRSTLSMPCEALLYFASRAQLVSEIVRPALAEGRIVLCDRYELATFAYQGHAGGLDLVELRAAALLATDGLQPDWTGVLDIDPETAAGRRVGPADRIEARSADFHRKVRDGFLVEAKRAAGRVSVIDAARDSSLVHRDIAREVERVLAAAGRA